ncbi:hypothetical protein [Burkholderia gladioli]|uniref:hypothetical protein n=1 Tax=Burkholderia gladioli TaxID=28095 RepID=UPI001641E8E2|nr:hypothetical protein [Burkholderia gladioli]
MDTFDDEPKPNPFPEYWGATINDPDGKAAYLITAGGGHDWELKLNGAELLLKLTHLDGRAGVLAAKAECLEVVTRINGILVNRFRTDGNLSVARMVSWVHGDPGYVDIPLSLVITQTSLPGLRYTPFNEEVVAKSEEARHRFSKLDLFWGQADSKSWSGLYKIFEIITEDPKGKILSKSNEWERQSTLFRASANNFQTGPSARHAIPKGNQKKSPPGPMALSDAVSFIQSLDYAYRQLSVT